MPDRPPRLRPPMREVRAPAWTPPPGACDTHFHIYFPESRFPLKERRRYTPVDATLEDYLRTFRRLGVERGVVVTGSAHADNDSSLAAIAAMGGAFKGLALIRPDATDTELARLAAGGMTGFRISTRSMGGLGPEHLLPLAERVRELGWHAEIHLRDTPEVLELLPLLRRLPIPYSIDHVAYLGPETGPGTRAFDAVRDHLAGEADAYLNLYAFYDLSRSGAPGYDDMVDVLGPLVAARPDRILWGSNWPHPSLNGTVPEDTDLLDFLPKMVPDEATRRLILTENPARLYGWTSA